MGLQGFPLIAGHADGMPLDEVLLPEYLQKLGYITRLIGKGHLGTSKTSMTPTHRGFHSHFGYYNGYVGYRNGIHDWDNVTGYDCYRNGKRSKEEVVGKYLTDVYTEEAVKVIKGHEKSTEPLFLYLSHLAPHAGAPGVLEVRNETENSKKFSYISDPSRRLYAGMMEALDDSIGAVVEALDSQNMLQKSVIIFIADNGGITAWPFSQLQNSASNWPLRGMKFSPFEGGVRGVSIAWSPLFKDLRETSEEYMHISDWLPTLYSAAGGNADLLEGLDGVNHWDYLIGKNTDSPRNELLVNILEEVGDWAIIKEKWKLVQVNATQRRNITQLYFGESGRNGEKYSMDLVTTSRVSQILRRNQPSDNLREEYTERRATLDMTSACAERIAAAASSSTDPFIPPDRCHKAPCLFNIHMDPCEFHDVAEQHPSVVDALQELVESYASEVVPVQNYGFDPASHPKNWDGWWAPWLDGSEGRGMS
nr:PREDICTED: arylsulfatase B-like [Bemisia tabaci]